jgi:Flp pilus assembly protein TadD
MRKTFILILCCIAVLLAGYAGYRGYGVWKRDHLMTLAHAFLAKSDARNALLCVQEVLRSDPQNLDATRVMAGLSGAARSPSALIWRSRVVELNPRSLDDRLALAQTAMMMRDYATATNALGGVDQAGKNTAAYHNIAGAVAVAANQLDQAEAHFLEAARLEPQNPVSQLNLAVVRLHGTNTVNHIEARAELELLTVNRTNSDLRCQALRELVADAVLNKQEDTALAMCGRLLQETNAIFADHILQLDVLRQTRDAGFSSALADCRREAGSDPGKIYELATWQMAKASPGEALAWLQSLPLNTRTNQAVELLTAECFITLHDWPGLEASVQKQNWTELEFIRHAFLSRALRGQELTDSAQVEWKQALQTANGQKQSLFMLRNLAAQWNWLNEDEELLSIIVERYPEESGARRALLQALYAGGRTRSLMQFFTQEVKRNPSDLAAKNNLAVTALLLNAQEFKPNDLAREVYQNAPTNSSYASTYAFSLYLQGKNSEALKVIEKLKPNELQDPSNSGYYGIILKAAGNQAQARTCLERALKGHLLPEEKKLFEAAKAGG